MAPTLAQRCARMFMVGFPGQVIDADFASMIDRGVFGAIFFKRNIEGPAALAELGRAIKERAARSFILSIDQEGGRVARLRGGPFTAVPPMRQIGRTGDPALAERIGRLLGYELKALGIDWDFAPVLDVDTNPNNPVIGDRSFGADPQRVAELGVALAKGLEAEGVASCGKHFPGHGDTLQDSHLQLPRLPHALSRLRQVELVPFRAYAKAGLSSLMTAHVIFEAVDPGVPATLSRKVLDGVLRGELGFGGVVVSDDLEMKAIADHYPIGEAAVLGTLAGVDLFLVCLQAKLQNEAIDALIHAVESGRVPRERIDQANRRLDALVARFEPRPDQVGSLGTAEHLALAKGLVASVVGPDPTERS